MTEALCLRLQAESAMWRQRGDAHLCALLDDASAALAQPSATSAEPADEPLWARCFMAPAGLPGSWKLSRCANSLRPGCAPTQPQPLKKRGKKTRDWRGTKILPEHERRLTLDLWEPLPSGDEMGPGIWYVWPGWNDASHDRLPWREATRAEKATFLRDNPGAKDAL